MNRANDVPQPCQALEPRMYSTTNSHCFTSYVRRLVSAQKRYYAFNEFRLCVRLLCIALPAHSSAVPARCNGMLAVAASEASSQSCSSVDKVRLQIRSYRTTKVGFDEARSDAVDANVPMRASERQYLG